MEKPTQIVGGPRDGDVVSYCGPVLRMPRPIRVSAFATDELPPMSASFEVDDYDFARWSDESGITQGRRYVKRDLKPGLQVP